MPLIKISERVKKRLEKLKKELKCSSLAEVIEALIKGIKEPEQAPELKKIITSKAAKCARCGAEIPIGATCWWSPPDTFVCYNCVLAHAHDEKVFKKHVELKELEAAIKGARKELDTILAEITTKKQELARLRAEIGLYEAVEIIKRLLEDIEHYERYLRYPESRAILPDVKEVLELAKSALKTIEAIRVEYLSEPRPKKRKAKIYAR